MPSILRHQIAKLISAIREYLRWGSLIPGHGEGFDFEANNVERYFEEKKESGK